MNVWTLVGLLGWVIPPLLIWWRFAREPRWLAAVRYLLAISSIWFILLLLTAVGTEEVVAAAEARGDWETVNGDTGANVAMLVFGWLPALCYVVLLGLLRRLWRRFAQKRAVARAAAN